MGCPKEIIEIIHDFLDDDIEPEKEKVLRNHLQNCRECQNLLNEMNKTIAFIKSTSNMQAPNHFTQNILNKLPKEKKRIQIQRRLQKHPFIAAASLFILLMFGSMLSTWQQDRDFSVSQQKNLIINHHTVIVPKGEIVKGDVMVQNGNLEIDGEVQGNVTVINGEKYMASAGHVTGEIKVVNEVNDWIWYYIKKTVKNGFDLFKNN